MDLSESRPTGSSLLSEYSENLARAGELADDTVANSHVPFLGLLCGDLTPKVVWKIMYLCRYLSPAVEDSCTMLSIISDYICNSPTLLETSKSHSPSRMVQVLAGCWLYWLPLAQRAMDASSFETFGLTLERCSLTLTHYNLHHDMQYAIMLVEQLRDPDSHRCQETTRSLAVAMMAYFPNYASVSVKGQKKIKSAGNITVPTATANVTIPTTTPVQTSVITMITTPSRQIPTTPARQISTTPACQIPVTPARPIPVTPARPIPVTPARPISATPARPIPTTPARQIPTTTACQIYTTPARHGQILTTPARQIPITRQIPTTLAHQIPTTPARQIPTSPARQIPTTPARQIFPTLFRQVLTTPDRQISTTPDRQIPITRQIPTTPACQIPTTPVRQISTTPADSEPTQDTDMLSSLSILSSAHSLIYPEMNILRNISRPFMPLHTTPSSPNTSSKNPNSSATHVLSQTVMSPVEDWSQFSHRENASSQHPRSAMKELYFNPE